MIQSLKDLLFKGFKALIIKIIGVLFAIVTSVILARSLSLNDYGVYSLSINILYILVVFSVYGIDQFIMKEFSLINYNFNDQISNLSYKSAKRSLLFIIVLYLGVIVYNRLFQANFSFLTLVVITAPIKSIALILGSYVNSKGNPSLSIFIKEGLFYISFAAFLSAFIVLSNKKEISLTTVGILYLVLMIISLMISIVLTKLKFRLKKNGGGGKLKLLPYFINNLSNTVKISIPILLISILLTSEEVALYSVPAQIMIGFTMLFSIMGTTFSPKISFMLKNKNYSEVRKLNKNAITVIGSMSLIGFSLIAVFGKEILSIWGEEFQTNSYPILLILASGQIVNIFSGFNSYFLLYTGNVKTLNYITILSLIITPMAIILFIKHYGLLGAALSVSISIILENLTKYYYAYKLVWRNV